ARRLFATADVAAAMSVEALLGTDRVFAADLQALRPHPGQACSAANLQRLLAGSAIVASHRASHHAVQDSYSLRCAPQVAGAARDTLDFGEAVAGRELASAVDNPVVLEDGRVESNGNFHGAPLGFACDFLAVAAAEGGAALKLRGVLENVAQVLAIEVVCAARAVDLRAPLTPAPATAAVRDLLRERVAGPGPDRYLAPELEEADRLVRSGAVLERAAA